MPEKLQFRDRREMQLFAERVLQYRFPDKQFQSFGYHQPDVEASRKVYTAADNTLYYFLPSVSPDNVETAITNIEQLLIEHPLMDLDGSARAIKAAVLVGEFESADGSRLSEADIEAIERSITGYQGHLEMGLSYIDEDLYWDIRRDRIETDPYNGNRTPVTEVLTALKSAPPVAPVTDRPRYASNPIAISTPTAVASTDGDLANHSLDSSRGGELALSDSDAAMIHSARRDARDEDQPRSRDRDSGGLLGWLEGLSSLALLAGIGLLGLLMAGLFLWRWLINPENSQPVTQAPASVTPGNPGTSSNPNGNLPVPQPPPNGDRAQPFAPSKTTPPAQPPAAPAANSPPATQAAANLWLIQSPSGSYNAVNLREGPGMGYRAIGAIRQGNYVVDTGEQQGNWRKVNYYNKTGWVYRSFIR